MVRTLFLWFVLCNTACSSVNTCDSSVSENCVEESDPSALLQKKIQVHEAEGEREKVHASPKPRHQRMVIPGHPVSLQEEQPSQLVQLMDKTRRSRKGGGLSEETVKEVEEILEHVAKEEGDKDATSTLNDIEEGGDEAATIEKDHDEVMKAIEEESRDVSPEDEFAATGTVITSQALQELNGLEQSPEEEAASNPDVVEGDMCDGSHGENATAFLQMVAEHRRAVSNVWKDSMNIPYCFSSTLAESSKKAFLDAVEHFTTLIPCLGFKKVSVKSDSSKKCEVFPAIYVFSSDSGCYANVGEPLYESWGSVCHLEPDGCDTMGIAAHELGHNLGMLHEQSRTDAGQYVKILWNNIKKAYKDQYDTSSNADTEQPYDVMSLMHYSDTSFGKSGKKTMEFVGTSSKPMGNRQGLTHADAKQVASMYGCLDKLTNFELCTEDVNGCSPSSCTCHAGALKKLKTSAGDNCYACSKECPDSPTGNSGACGCPEGKTKSCFTSGGTQYCGCAASSSDSSSSGGSSSAATCPDSPTGTTGECTCPAGKTKSCFNSDGKTYCGCDASSSSGVCSQPDSTTYKDPTFNDPCEGWIGFKCTGYHFTAELQTQCPHACSQC